jgi:transposase InsO family protein
MTGWQLRTHMREELVMEAFVKSWNGRQATAGLIIHSDRGGQYAGKKFRKLLNGLFSLQSMSGTDNPYDNAFMESYFSRFKAELLRRGL